MKENPFSFYDFLGYLIPGAVFLFILNFIFKIDIVISLSKPVQKPNQEMWFFIILIILSYITGHVFSLLSSFFIERFSMYLYGYPSKYLFIKQNGIFSFPENENTKIGWTKRILLSALLLPISIILITLKIFNITFFDQAKTLQKDLGNVIFDKCIIVLTENLNIQAESICNKKEKEGLGNDYFRIIYHFIFENSEKHSSKLQNYVALYGFCRNISFVFLVSFWLSLYFFTNGKHNYYSIIIYSLLSFIFFTGFVKFYRRYTLEALMGVTVFNKHSKNK